MAKSLIPANPAAAVATRPTAKTSRKLVAKPDPGPASPLALAAQAEIVLAPLRAPDHRRFIGPAFNAGVEGTDPAGLTYLDILANPMLADLGRRVFGDLKAQFSQDAASQAESDETRVYRQRLEGWASVLEIMLDEVLSELEALSGGPGQGGGVPHAAAMADMI